MSVNCCRKCGSSMIGEKGEHQIVCAQCAARDSHSELLALQAELLPKAVERDHYFRLLRRAGANAWHIELIGPYRGQGWCGVLFVNPGRRSEWVAREVRFKLVDRESNLCEQCRAALAERVAALPRLAAVGAR